MYSMKKEKEQCKKQLFMRSHFQGALIKSHYIIY